MTPDIPFGEPGCLHNDRHDWTHKQSAVDVCLRCEGERACFCAHDEIEVLMRRAVHQPLNADISDYGDEWCEGFLQGQVHALGQMVYAPPSRMNVCGALCPAGPNGEMLGCGFKYGHDGIHAWGFLPTWVRT